MKIKFTNLYLLLNLLTFSQENILSGYIKDGKTGEALIGASVFLQNPKIKELQPMSTGFILSRLSSGNCDVKFSYIGYKEIVKTIQLENHKRVNVELIESEDLLEEMIVNAEQSDENTNSTQMGKVELSMDKIKTIPAFMGEVDILKTIQFLPGVSSGGEGNTGFYVRGGGYESKLNSIR